MSLTRRRYAMSSASFLGANLGPLKRCRKRVANKIAAKNPRKARLGSTRFQRFRLKVANGISECCGSIWARLAQYHDCASCRKDTVGDSDVGVLEVKAPGAEDDRIILYFHGGAYVLWSANTHRELLGRLSKATRARVVGVNYRLAPKDPYPAALEDALAAFRWVKEQNPSAQIVVGGDSAGGNLTFALMLRLSQLGEQQPIAAFAFAPWLLLHPDLVEERRQRSEQADSISHAFWNRGAGNVAALYAHNHPSDDPLVSPVLASVETVSSFPPVLIHADQDEPLAEDAKDMASLCKQAGVPVELKLYSLPYCWPCHVFQAFPLLYRSAAEDSLEQVDRFLARHWIAAATSGPAHEEPEAEGLA